MVDFQYKSLSLFHLVCEMSAGKLLAIMTAKQSFSCYLEFFIQLKIYLFLILVLCLKRSEGKRVYAASQRKNTILYVWRQTMSVEDS